HQGCAVLLGHDERRASRSHDLARRSRLSTTEGRTPRYSHHRSAAMPYPTIVGIDPSLSETGFVRIDGNRDHGQIIPSAPAGDASAARYARLSGTAATLVDLTPPGSLVVIEAPAYSRVQGHVHDRSGLWWTIYHALVMQRQAVMYPVTVQHRMRYAT